MGGTSVGWPEIQTPQWPGSTLRPETLRLRTSSQQKYNYSALPPSPANTQTIVQCPPFSRTNKPTPVERVSEQLKEVKMVDIPERTESHGPVFIYGVEGEQIEEENDAYNDLRYDIGLHKDYEDEMEETMPSCFPLLIFDCVFMHFKKCIMPNSKDDFKDEKEEY